MMLIFLILVTVFAFWGTLNNKRMNNKFGTVVSGLFSVILAGITALAALVTFGIIEL